MGKYVVFVHGIGEQQRGSYGHFERRVREAFEEAVRKSGRPAPSPDTLVWEESYWADVTQPDQEEMERRLRMGGRLRQLMIGSLGDAVAYSKLTYPPDKYGQIQERFASAVQKLSQHAHRANDSNAQLTVIAHSMGTVIASDGITI